MAAGPAAPPYPTAIWLRGRRLICFLRLGAAVSLLLFALAWLLFPFPVAELARYPAGVTLLDREGEPLRVRLGPQDQDCQPYYRADPDRDWICRAIVAAEDRRFWKHPGIDPLAIGRALEQNIAHGRVVSGASTLSTQVVRLLHPRRRTLAAKAVEMFRALQLETALDKRAILEQYLNRAPFGGNAIGIQAASRRYFGREPAELSLAEAALLAGIPQMPSRLRPDRFPERARRRQAYVLDRMLARGTITAEQDAEARRQRMDLQRARPPFRAPHFVDLVLESRTLSAVPAARLRTTLDPAMQRLAEEALRRQSALLQSEGVFGGALVVLEVKSGAVRALVGSPSFADRRHAGQVDGALAPRSAGSTLKPFLYALAIDQGRLTPDTLLADVPRTFKDLTPANFDGDFQGPVSARTALVLSLNIPALTLTEQIGVTPFLGALRQAGLETLRQPASHYGLSLALGDAPVRLIDLAGAYACLARGGEWRPAALVEPDSAAPAERSRRAFSAEAAWLVSDMLSGDERAADTTGHCGDVRLPRMAWKTGTSSGLHDAWAVGYNPDYVVAVWFGNPDGRASPALVGARAAVPALWELVRALYPRNDAPWFSRPAAVAARRICALSGQLATADCPCTADGWSIAGVSLARPCALHVGVAAADGTRRVRQAWPAELAEFLRQRERREAGDAEPVTPRLVSPRPDTIYRRLDDVSLEQRLPLRATGRAGDTLYWFVDDGLVATGADAAWPLAHGRHTIVCSSASGASARADITVE